MRLKPIDLPNVHRTTLPNGLRVVVTELPHLHTVSVGTFVRVGSRYEDPSTNGLSHFLEHMLFRGTEAHPTPYDYNLAVESLGASLRAATHVDFTVYDLSLPPENFAAGLTLLGDAIRTPRFGDIETEKQIVAEEILGDLDEEGHEVDVENLSRRLLFGAHPLAFKITGEASQIERFTEADLERHHRAHYGARNQVVSVAGPLAAEEAFRVVRAAFGALPPGNHAEISAPPADTLGSRYFHATRRSSQTDVRLCFRTFGQRDPRAIALHVLSRVLDDGLSTRVFRRLCEDTGLAYDAFASAETYEDAGVFDFGAAANHDKVAAILDQFAGIVRELRIDGPTEREVEQAKNRHLWNLLATLDHAEAMMHYHGVETLFGIEDPFERLLERVRAVTPEDVRAVAGDLFAPHRAHAVVVGAARTETTGAHAFARLFPDLA
ncbi:MAG: pitrilysin family protein [Polyangiales bacterium]|nr:insulinase family protein [Myxococcales bacterium]